jgi:ribonuclease BN (tRNA processing enzyme)
MRWWNRAMTGPAREVSGARVHVRRSSGEQGAQMSVKVTFLGSGDSFGSGGRFQTCILVDTPTTRFLIDCGASSMIAMRAQGIEPNEIDVILLSHLHGDHCAGVPFILLDAMLGSKRQKPLVIAGPRGMPRRMDEVREALFPGSGIMKPRFPLEWIELEPGETAKIGSLAVRAWPAIHTAETLPLMLRVDCDGKSIAFTGDTDWTDDLIPLAENADLLIAECYFYDKPIKMHMTYQKLAQHREQLKSRKVVLTHMSPEMLANQSRVTELCAHDGMVIEI